MANDLTINQLSTILNDIMLQATGKKSIAATNTAEFVSVAQTALKIGYDPLLNAISQVLARTIFSVRPYNRKFKGIQVSNQKYGNHVRKLQMIDSEFEDDDRMELVDGDSIDMYTVAKPKVLQTNFYGQETFAKHITIFRDQLDTAFSSADEFGQFVSMVMQNANDTIEQAHENLARMILANFIGGKCVGDQKNVIKLVTEYNDVTGLTLDSDTVKKPENYVPFMKWVYSRIRTLADSMSERSIKYHINIEDKEIARHTPLNRLKAYLYAPELNQIDSTVLSSTFNEQFLKMVDHERVNFWQSIDTPMGINVVPTYMNVDGSLVTPSSALVQSNIFGVLFDEEALGYTVVNQWSSPTPFNARGGYSNLYWHFTDRYWNDFTENGIVLLLE